MNFGPVRHLGAFNQTGRHYLQVTEEARDFFPRSHAAPVPARALQDEPGSYVVISMGSGDEQTGARLARAYTATTLYNHPASQVARFMDGLELVGPGVVDARHWEPSGAARATADAGWHTLTAVGRKA